jgi:glycosyltransferase involved in cell wall biosynthesis
LDLHPELKGKRLFTFIADHNPIEGIHMLVEAIEALTRKGIWNPQTMRLVVAGAKDEATMTVMGRIAGSRGVSESVSLVRYTADKGADDVLSVSEVFLRPSSYEICGHKIADALSAGVPAIMSTGVAVWRDVVNDGAGIAEDETPEGFGRALRRWIGMSEEERASFRAKASICFEMHFTQVAAAHTLTSAIYLLVGVHRDSRWDLKPLKPASELG